jgi:NADPH:quinone reductase-like Zn-dependent oxidoreductase
MRAIVCTRYGPPEVLRLAEVEKPVPRDNEVLIRVRAATAMMGDCEMRGFDFPLWMRPLARIGFGIRGPRKKILGQELSGDIESVGKDVRRFREGDAVFAATGFRLGAYAEYACLPGKGAIALKPSNMSYQEAAAVPVGGLTALHYLREARIRPGQRVLINGAGGTIGTFAVQLARSFGAEVVAVDSAKKLDMLRSLGAEKVIDYAKEDFAKSDETYDVIFDVVGKSRFSDSMSSLKENGCYLLANPGLSQMVRGRLTSRRGGKKVVTRAGEQTAGNLDVLRGLIEAGKVRSVIDRTYPLERTAEAHRYVEEGHKLGNVVITINVG